MSKYLSFPLILLSFILTQCNEKQVKGAEEYGSVITTGYGKIDIADLVLIYQGGVHRPYKWTKDKFLPYVVHEDQEGNKNWLFDGFLFLEFKDGKGRNFAPGYDNLNARRKEWEWLLDRRFAVDTAFSALNSCIKEQKELMGNPNFKHKVMSGMPSPILNQKDWGHLNGKALDFSKVEDRLAAAKWYIDQFLMRFYNENYQHLNFSGFYWVDEDVTGAVDILPSLASYVRSKGLKFYWIPYWNAAGSHQWKSYKFDFAWLQPNYFFQDVDRQRLNAACNLAFEKNMGLEMEFDSRALFGKSDNRRDRLMSYIDVFDKNKVFQNSSIAYYQGGTCIYDFYKSTHPKDKEAMDLLAKFIIERKSRWYSPK